MRKVLVVDDDLVVLATLSMGLKLAGYQVFQADSGEKALQIEQVESPDIAILDMRMPGMDGLMLAEIFRERGRTPFIFLSAFSDETIVQAAASAGALGYLVKPLEISRIVPAIEVAVMRHDDLSSLEEIGGNLAEAMKNKREIDVAIGLLMERYQVDRASAFNAMRNYARSHRSKVEEISQRLVAGERIDLLKSGTAG